jgi:hypothetical protein
MARPVVTPTTEIAHASMGPWARADADTDWQLLRFLEAALRPLDTLEQIARDTPDGDPGWSSVLDVDRAPVGWVEWLGQMVGVTMPPGLADAEQRDAVRDASGWRRGTLGAITAAAQLLLTGTKRATVVERYGANPYALYVATYAGQTADPTAVEASIRLVKPGGITLTYEVIAGLMIDDLVGTIDAQTVTIDGYTDLTP